MNGLKKFQEFALNADEQKNVKGGRLAVFTCYTWNAAGTGFDQVVGEFATGASAVIWCKKTPNCAYCN